ncbi:MAG: hypothetical protein QMD50_03100 [Patescibacteria group bacterium]|nr:hypothetical protein [Patescibacteria group bacterium]
MNRQTIIYIVVGLIIALLVAGYFLWYKPQFDKEVPDEEIFKEVSKGAETITEKASEGVLPSIDVGSNPLEDKPVINPAEKANPFKAVKTNPFE